MRIRLLITACVLIVATAIAGPAWAGFGDGGPAPRVTDGAKLSGPIDSKGSVWFRLEVRRRDGKRIVRVADFHFRKLPLRCQGDNEKITNFLALKPRVVDGDFKQVAVIRSASGKVLAKLTLIGELRRRGRKAEGTIRIAGDKVPVDSGGARKCKSGRLGWTAKL